MARLRRRAVVAGAEERDLLARCCDRLNVEVPELLLSGGIRSPFLTGLRRPRIFLPASLPSQVPAEDFQAILIHELTHLKRRDCWWGTALRVLCAIAWPQPLVWVLARQLEQASEEICDRAVVESGREPASYATCLIQLAERLLPVSERSLGLGMVPIRSSLGRRVQEVLRARTWQPLSRQLRASVMAGVLIAAVAGLLLVSVGRQETAASALSTPILSPAPAAGEAPVESVAIKTPPRIAKRRRKAVRLSAPQVVAKAFPAAAPPAEPAPPVDVQPEAAAPAEPAVVPVASEEPAPATATITGRVLTPEGRPAAGVQVAAYPRKLMSPVIPDLRTARGEAVTDARGGYRIEGLQDGLYAVFLRSEPTGDYVYPEAVYLNPVPGHSTHAPDYHLLRAVIVTGTLTDETGAPLPDLMVSGQRANGTARPLIGDSVRTDKQGRFRLRLGPGRNNIQAYPPPPEGFRSGWLLPGRRATVVELKLGKPMEIQLRIDPTKLPKWKEYTPRPEPAHL